MAIKVKNNFGLTDLFESCQELKLRWVFIIQTTTQSFMNRLYT